jgi:hypothetical protein
VHGVSKKANWEFKNYPERIPLNNNPMGFAKTMPFVFATPTALVYFLKLTEPRLNVPSRD